MILYNSINMKINVIGSGSKGNSTLIEFEKSKILIDVGFSYKYMKEKLEELEVKPNEIDYIFITHDHSDHIKGLQVFLNRNNPKLYVSSKIAEKYDYMFNYLFINVLEEDLCFKDFKVKVIPTSHDATDSYGYVFTSDESLVYLTDSGYINIRNFKYMKNKEYYIFESNHDVNKLIKGTYPEHLQRRILSDTGHLSNESSSIYLSKLIGPKTKKIVLAHLSHENNTEDLALETFKKITTKNNIIFENVICAKQDCVVNVVD